MDEEQDLIKEKVNQETSKILWSELQRFFASGSAVFVSAELDLVTVSEAFAKDDKEKVAAWMKTESIHLVSDAQAVAWLEQDIMVWAVVIKPWILVQIIE
mgnify:CR=1